MSIRSWFNENRKLGDGVKAVIVINQSDKSYSRHAILSSTFWDVHCKRASRYLLACKCYIDNMGSFQYRSICAAENAVPSVLQYDLHCVPAPLWIYDDHSDITCARTWKDRHIHVICFKSTAKKNSELWLWKKHLLHALLNVFSYSLWTFIPAV